MQFGESLHERQPYAQPGNIIGSGAALERLEDAPLLGRWDTRPVVLDDDPCPLGLLDESKPDV